MLRLLLKPKILSLRNSWTLRIFLRRLPFMAIGAAFWVLIYVGSLKALGFIREIEIVGEIISDKLFSMLFLSLTGLLAMSNIITSISSFYLAKDVPYLLSKPVEIRDILRLKTTETALNSSWMVMSFTPPILFAYGTAYGAPASYYLLSVLCLFLFILTTAGAGITAAHLLARAFPARRSRDVLLGLCLVLFLMIYFSVKSSIPEAINAPEDLLKPFMGLKADSRFMPGRWVVESVLPALRKKSPDPLYPAVLFINAVFLIMLSEALGMKLFRTNFERMQPSGGGAKFLKSYYPSRAAATAYKDVRMFFRDAGQWSQLFIIGSLMMVYLNNFRSIPVESLTGVSPYFREIMIAVNMTMAGMVLSAVASRFIFTAVSLEGRAFWIIRSAPVDMKKFLASKLIYTGPPVAAAVTLLVFSVNSAMKADGLLLWGSTGCVLMLCVSVGGLGAGMGALYPRFKYDNIASVSIGIGGMVFMITAFGLVLATLALSAWIYYALKIKGVYGALDSVKIACAAIAVLAMNAAAFCIPMKAGGKKLSEFQES